MEFPGENRFAGAGKSIIESGEIDVCTSNYNDARRPCHNFPDMIISLCVIANLT
jgi:hypothetical protein